jgi:hypothetical protein
MSYLDATNDLYKKAALTPDVGLCCTTTLFGNSLVYSKNNAGTMAGEALFLHKI